METLKERLARRGGDWQDPDYVEMDLAVLLGVVGEDDLAGNKWVFWSANPVGDALFTCLETLAKAGVLEQNDDNEFRWNPAFTLE